MKDEKGLGTISNINGKYSIKIQQYQTLVFSYIGFKTVSILVKGDTKVINIKMQEEKNKMLLMKCCNRTWQTKETNNNRSYHEC